MHVFDLQLARAPDAVIWQHVVETSAVVVTKDEDFAVLTQLRSPGPSVVWVRFGNACKEELLRRFANLWPKVVQALSRGETLIELV